MRSIARVACSLVGFALVPRALAETMVAGGPISTQSWTAAQAPYRLQGDVTIPYGVTLTIEPGVTVVAAATDGQAAGLDTTKVELVVEGALVADGTPESPIAFTGETATAGAWYGIVLASTATGSLLDNVVISYPVEGLRLSATGTNTYSAIDVQHASSSGASILAGSPTLDRFSASFAGYAGVNVREASVTLTRCLLRDGGSGVSFDARSSGRVLTVDHCTLARNGTGVSVIVANGATATVTSSIVVGSWSEVTPSYGISSTGGAMSVDHSDVWGNNLDYSMDAGSVTSSISTNPLFVSSSNLSLTSNSPARFGGADGTDMGAFPYVGDPTPGPYGTLWTDTTLSAAASPHAVLGDLTVAPGVTLTIEPGTELQVGGPFAAIPSGSKLRVEGTLIADGTPQSPITITGPLHYWYGVVIGETASGSVIDNVIIENPRTGLDISATGSNSYSSITVTNASSSGARITAGNPTLDGFSALWGETGVKVIDAFPTLTNCVLFQNFYGIDFEPTSAGRTLTVDHCTIAENVLYGVFASSSSGGTAAITNSIVGGINVPTLGFDTYGIYASGVDTSVDHSDVWGNTFEYVGVTPSVGNISADPLLADRWPLTLLPSSPCIDAGTATPGYDAAGMVRPVDGDGDHVALTDMGAYEFGSSTVGGPPVGGGGGGTGCGCAAGGALDATALGVLLAFALRRRRR